MLICAAATSTAKPWPKKYNAPPARWEPAQNLDGYLYLTRSYTIVCTRELERSQVDGIATMAEAVGEALELFPLRLLSEAEPAADGDRPRFTVRILPNREAYHAAGGPVGSVGYFDGRTTEVKVNLEMLIEPKGPRSNLEPRQRYRLLVHELVHQWMGRRIAELPLWFVEGIAEYFSAMQFSPGRYNFEDERRAIISHLQTVWVHDKRRQITLPSIDTLAKLTSGSWSADNRMNTENAYAKYAGSLLLTHYFLQQAKHGRGGLKEFLVAGPEAVPDPRREGMFRLRPPSQKALWKERPPAAVQRALTSYWKTRGLELRFAPLRPIKIDTPKKRHERAEE